MKNVRINGKWDILLPDHRADRVEWHKEPYWEGARVESMHKHLTADDMLFYVGAEEGDFAGLISSWGVELMLFEPNEKVWANIKAIWEANNLKYCGWYPGFASDKTTNDEIRFGFQTVTGPLISDHGFMELQNHNAPEIKIDDIRFAPTALSIDVEGSEWQVLRGAEHTLRNYHPKIWLSVHPEFMFRMYGEYQQDLRNWIKDLGYKEEILDYQHELHLYYEHI